MKNFVILFQGHEGTSPLVRLLDNFDRVSIVHQVENSGWEPFDSHNCGPIKLEKLEQCLDLVFDPSGPDMAGINSIYSQRATRPLEVFDRRDAVGFKMRFLAPMLPGRLAKADKLVGPMRERSFKKAMIDVFKRRDVSVLFAWRQDMLRLGLSNYHGDGTGKKGHLQFHLASGQIKREDIGKIDVDCDTLEEKIRECEAMLDERISLMKEFRRAGIATHALYYEDFCSDKTAYFKRFFELVDLQVSETEIDSAIEKGAYFKKVHSNDISDFVLNHEEVLKRFGNRFVSCPVLE